MPRECLAIIESKSKVCYSRNKPVVAKVSTNASTSTTDGNNYRDNIQEFVSQAFAVNYNQGNTSYRPPMMSNQIRPPGFPPVPNNQNVQRNNQNCFIPNQNQGNNSNQGPVYQPLVFQPPAYQAPTYQASAPQTQGVSKEDFLAYVKANDAVMKNMQMQCQNMQNQLTNLTNLIIKFVNSNTASTSSSGTLPSSTIANLKSDLKVITTRSGVSYDGPQIPPSPSSLPKVVENEPEVTKDTVNPTNNGNTEDVQPQAVQSKSLVLISKPVTSPISEPAIASVSGSKPNPKASIPYPSRRNNERNRMAECLALADLGASINLMPFSMWKVLSLLDLTPSCLFHFPVDFVVVDFDADPRVPLIIGRSFLKIERALIDVFEGELTLRVGKEAITFNLYQTSRYSANYSDMTAKRIDVIDMACEEYSQEVLSFFDTISSGNPTSYYDPIVFATSSTLSPFRNSDFLLKKVDAFLAIEDEPTSSEFHQSYLDPEGDILLLEAFLNDDPSLPPPNQRNYLPEEVLGFSDTISSGNPTPFYDPIVSTTSPTLTPFGNSDFLLEEVDAFLAVEDEPTSSEFYQPYLDPEGDILLLEAFLNDDPSPLPYQGNYMPEVRKDLKICEAHSKKLSVDKPHVAELKELPPRLEYAFLEGDDKLPVIIAKDLSVEEKTALITRNNERNPLIGNKKKLSEMAGTPLNERCSTVLLKKLPEKLGDPGKFLIPCDFLGMAKCLALVDLGASINLMPFSIWKVLSLLDLTPSCITLELVDRSLSHPVRVAEDVYVNVGLFHFPADFVVVDFDADPRVPLIIRRSFLKTERALIDVFEGELTLRVGKEAITFNLYQTSRYSANYSGMTAKRIDIIDMAYEEYSQEVLGFFDTISSGNPTSYYDPIVAATSPTLSPFRNSDFLLKKVDAFLAIEDEPTSSEFHQSYLNPEGDILLLEAFLNDDPSLPPPNQRNYLPEVRKELKICEAKSNKSSVDEPPVVELKVLPPHLEYAFLEGDDKLPIIIAKDLSVEEKTALITVLMSHKRAIAWKLFDIKGINPEFCTYKILMEEDFEPTVQH
uniref:Reverse transcriptase domain-containing protein n=1 Tax=Tanacetum cinerariifolium TaxID=118510 RepID=A0A699III3_TANCI|nr:reverse transcriptase domain-containing protein [Tanacetum cinerariifolium]